MKYITLAGTDIKASNIIMGCMRIAGIPEKELNHFINTAMEEGINYFDHADIYGGGESETHFAKAVGMNPSLREKMYIQSKCGIRKGFFDFSKEYIISSVDSILKRLQTEYLDVLLLHRPDTLMEPEEVAEAFEDLRSKG
jgi:predicted oxidoreductase